MLLPINDETRVMFDTEAVSKEVINGQLQALEVTYIQTVNWLYGLPMVLAKNNPENEEDAKNIEEMRKQKEKFENNLDEMAQKIKFFKELLTHME